MVFYLLVLNTNHKLIKINRWQQLDYPDQSGRFELLRYLAIYNRLYSYPSKLVFLHCPHSVYKKVLSNALPILMLLNYINYVNDMA